MADVDPQVDAATDLAASMLDSCASLFVGQDRVVIGEAAVRLAGSLLISLSDPAERAAALMEASRWLAERAAEEAADLSSMEVAGHG